MPTTYKILGQSDLTAATNTDVYTAPSATQTVISSIIVCNRENTARTFRLAIRPNGDSLSNAHYIAYDTPLGANDTITMTLGITIDASDVITARSATSATVTVSVFGAEIT